MRILRRSLFDYAFFVSLDFAGGLKGLVSVPILGGSNENSSNQWINTDSIYDNT